MPTARTALRGCVEPLLGYAIALAVSLGLMALVVGALAAQSAGSEDDLSGDIDIEALGTLVGMPFQLAGMALGGSLHLGDDEFGVALFAPPLLVTAVFVAAVFFLSRRAERAQPLASSLERAVVAAGGSFAAAAVATAATRLLAMRDDGTVMHAASVGLFFGVLCLALVAGSLGRSAAIGGLWPRWLSLDARRAVHLVSQHVLAWVVLAVPIAAVWLVATNGVEAGLFALVWGPTVALGAFALGHVGAVSFFGEQEFAWDLGLAPGIVLPLLAVLLTLVVSTAWHLRRGGDPELLAQPVSWVALPVAYATAALTICLLSTVALSGALYGSGGTLSIHVAYWLVAVLAVWGGAIEALSRFAAPAIANALPRGVAQRLAKTPTAQPPRTPPSSTERIPMSPSDRRRAKRALIGVGVVGGLALIAFIVTNVLGSVLFTPEKQAEAYLDALVDGDATAALELAPVNTDEADVELLEDAIYRTAEGRVTGYEITDVTKLGSTATVTVDLEGVDEGEEVELRLESVGRRALFFDEWEIADDGLASVVTVSVPESSSSLQVNGTSVPVTGGSEVDLWALPGSYFFNPFGDSEWLEPAEVQTSVPPSTWGVYAEFGDPAPSEELKGFVDAEIAEWIDGCMTSTEPDPEGCPQEVYPYGDETRNLTWTLVSMPTVSWDGFYGTFPADLYSDTEGEATATYEYDESFGFGAPEWVEETESSSIYVNVTVDLVDGEPEVTFDTY